MFGRRENVHECAKEIVCVFIYGLSSGVPVQLSIGHIRTIGVLLSEGHLVEVALICEAWVSKGNQSGTCPY